MQQFSNSVRPNIGRNESVLLRIKNLEGYLVIELFRSVYPVYSIRVDMLLHRQHAALLYAKNGGSH